MTQSVCGGGEEGNFGKARGLQISTNKGIITIDLSCTKRTINYSAKQLLPINLTT